MRYLVCFVLVLSFSVPVAAQDFQKGLEAYQRNDYTAALRELRPLAEQGNAGAQFTLGLMYNFGRGVAQDDTEAMKWYLTAAEQGLADAQFRLGYMFSLGNNYVLYNADLFKDEEALQSAGRDVPQDDTEAVKWYRKAAEQGFVPAQHALGVMYDAGIGVPQDDVQAHLWLNLAAIHLRSLQEVPPDQVPPELLSLQEVVTWALGNVAKRMAPEQIAKAQHLASEWLEMHGKAE